MRRRLRTSHLFAVAPLILTALACGFLFSGEDRQHPAASEPFAPVALAEHDGSLLVLGAKTPCLARFAPDGGAVDKLPLPAVPSGLAIDGDTAYITAGVSQGRVFVVDLKKWKIEKTLAAGHTPVSPVARDGRLWFLDRFANALVCLDPRQAAVIRRHETVREPVALKAAPGGGEPVFWVANLLPAGRADKGDTAAVVSVFEAGARTDIPLPNGSHSVRDIAFS
ncbi:MAG: hypothetical protein LBM92_04850, partial [Opitutaceae bacterium]|nr:hypothetical protein [Opitutaceae bacterium]